MTHAIYQNDDKKALGNEGDWTASKFMYEEGGLGYIAAHLDKNSGLKLKIFCDTR